ncbi:MAG TPA: MFS transporter [Kineosporiaceae bacterium]
MTGRPLGPRLLVLVTPAAVLFTQTVTGPALLQGAHDLGRPDLTTWPVGAALLASTIGTPFLGRTADRYGMARVMWWSLAALAASSVVSGLAPTMAWLIAARAGAGLASGGLLVVAASALRNVVPRAEFARFQGLSTTLASVSTVVAPAVGGFLAESVSWRWSYLAAVPIAVVLMPLHRGLPEASGERGRLDVAGGLLLVLASGSLLATARTTVGPPMYRVTGTILLLAAAALGTAAFAWQEQRADHPLVHPDLFASRLFARCSLLSTLYGVVLSAFPVQLQLFLQGPAGLRPAEAALQATPLPLFTALASTLYGRLGDRAAVGRRLAWGYGVSSAGLLLVVAHVRGVGPLLPGTVLLGAGLGLIQPAIGAVALYELAPSRVTSGVAVVQTCRTLGGALGATLLSTLVVPNGGSGAVSGLLGPFEVLAVTALAGMAVAAPLRTSTVAKLIPRHRRSRNGAPRGTTDLSVDSLLTS